MTTPLNNECSRPTDSAEDAELVTAVRAGDRPAFSQLVERHLQSVHGLAFRILRNRADAEEIAQDAFLRAFERLEMCDSARLFRSWLLKITANLAINRLRSKGREHRMHLRLAEPGVLPNRQSSGPAAPRAMDWAPWLDQLETRQRLAIVLFHFHEMPYTDIAELLDVPVGTVRTYLHRGRRRLRDLLSAKRSAEGGSWTAAM